EARLITRLRDERGFYSDAWGTGLLRRTVLAAGEKATEAGLLDEPELMLDATFDEVVAAVEGDPSVHADELRARRSWRTSARPADAPPWLGAPPAPPPPPEWLPAHA